MAGFRNRGEAEKENMLQPWLDIARKVCMFYYRSQLTSLLLKNSRELLKIQRLGYYTIVHNGVCRKYRISY